MRSLCLFAFVLWLGCGELPMEPDGGGLPPSTIAASPIAPSAGKRMYQGTQRQLKTVSGGVCNARVAASISGSGFCFLAADDNVKCAGTVGGVVHGMAFKPVGQSGVEQILVMPLDNGMCVTRTDHTALCMGTNTTALGAANAAFTRWTARTDLAALASGTWEQLCGITLAGQVVCGGGVSPMVYGNPPINLGTAGQTGLWVDLTGTAQLSDAAVLRPSEGRAECQITATGMKCGASSYGPQNGTVVAGTLVKGATTPLPCWLTDNGSVSCSDGPRFAPNKVLLLAASTSTDSMCAIYSDGSVWCLGSNTAGKLGTGTTTALATATMVAPAGSAMARCE